MEGVLRAIALLLALLLSAQVTESYPKGGAVQTVWSWDQFHYDNLPHSKYTDVGGYPYYNATSILPLYLSIHSAGECMYVAVPRRQPGVPATIVYYSVKDQYKKTSPYFRGFPTYEDNYLPGWFGVDNLAEEDYNVYPGDSRRDKRGTQKRYFSGAPVDTPKRYYSTDDSDEEQDDDESRKSNSQYDGSEYYQPYTGHHRPSHGHHGHGHHGQVVYPVYPTAPPPTHPPPPPPTTPRPTYKPTYKPTHRPTYKPTYRPTYKPQKPSYKPPYESEESYESYYEPQYKPTYKPQKPSYKPPYESEELEYEPPYKPTYKPQKPSYKPPYVPEEPEYERPYKPPYNPPYKPPYKPSKPSRRNSYHFISVENTAFSPTCSRIYFLDTGALQYPKGTLVIRNPVLWGFDVYGCDESSLDQPPALKIKFPNYVYEDATGFRKFIVDDYGPSCSEFALYIANTRDNRIVVYDNVKRSFWYFDHETFQPGAELAYLPAGSVPSQDPFNLGILSLIIANTVKYSYKEILYAPGSSYGLFRTTTKVLRDKHKASGSPTSSDFGFVGYRGPEAQSTFIFDGIAVVFSVSWVNNRLTCWNTNKPLVEKNVVTLFSDLQFGVDLCFDDDSTYLWFMNRNLDFDLNKKGTPVVNDYYYRVYKTKVSDLIRGTNCE